MFYAILVLCISIGYYYRRFIFIKIVSLMLLIWKWKIEMKLRYMQKRLDKMTKSKTVVIDGDAYIEYNVVYNDKTYTLVFVSNSNSQLHNDILEFKNSMKQFLDYRNWIVHCSITDMSGNIFVDATEDFRQFCFYFDKSVSINMFLKFLQKNKVNDTSLLDYNISLYMNDEYFTEKTYNIRDIYHSNFNNSIFDNRDVLLMEDLD